MTAVEGPSQEMRVGTGAGAILAPRGDSDVDPTEFLMDGRWRLVDVVLGGRFDGLVVGFDLLLQRDGRRVRGVGLKQTVGRQPVTASERSTLELNGELDDAGLLTASFVESVDGEERLRGSFVWIMCEGHGAGRFDCSVASGRSQLMRLS